jgi:hypothetical protein
MQLKAWHGGIFQTGPERLFAGLFIALFVALGAPAEIVFQDFFTQPAGSVTASVPWIDVQGGGWQLGSVMSQLDTDGNGHLYNAATNAGAAASAQLIPIGPHGSLTAQATMDLPIGSPEWIGMGFGNANEFLTASSTGPWVQVQGTGAITLYGGTGLSNPIVAPNAFTNTGNPIKVFLTYDAFHAQTSVGTVIGGVTNLVFNQLPVTNSLSAITARYFIFQFPTNQAAPTARWVADASVDWIPRPLPLLTLTAPISKTVTVGAPGTNDIALIQAAFNQASSITNFTEIRFTAGATYVLSNTSLVSALAVNLLDATNVLVNGNGCKILIKNPRIGFINVSFCSNVIVEGFSVDYDPLPFTQGIVTHNFWTGGDIPKQSAIEFQLDAGYPAPTNANYLDDNAQRWGTVMNPLQPGRGADNSLTICIYTNVIQTNVNGAYKVQLPFSGQAASIPVGAVWCMISRWNGSMVFNAHQSYQVTFLNNTNYTGAGASYTTTFCPLVSEINDQVLMGPPPAGATAPRRRTSNADGGLMVESRIGPWVQGCNFTGLSDDVANACVNPFVVASVPSPPANTFTVGGYNDGGAPIALIPAQVQFGDNFIFFNAVTGVVFDQATVIDVSLPDISFDHVIPNLVPGLAQTNTLLFNLSLNTSAVYLDNHFSNSRIHGIYCRADNMLIAHNTISGMGLSAISAFPALNLSQPNSFAPTNVVIMDNVLSDCSFSENAISNDIPTEEPAYALVELHKTLSGSDYVPDGFDISGIRILYNAFLNWRRAPLSLHNVTDVNVIGNYFGPPITSDGLIPLSDDVIADLWVSDYPNMIFANNVNATGLANNKTIAEDNFYTPIAGAFQAAAGPQLAANVSRSNVVVGWASPSPGFVLQQVNRLGPGTNNWQDVTNNLCIAAMSNSVTLPLSSGSTNFFFRARQR